jgi:hypothetical protein
VRRDTIFETSMPAGTAAEAAVRQLNPYRMTEDNPDPLLAELTRLGVEYPLVSSKLNGQPLTKLRSSGSISTRGAGVGGAVRAPR